MSAQGDVAPSPPTPAEEAVAQSLFEAGRSLMSEGRTEEACGKFEESNRIAPSAGTTLNLGKCLDAQGKTASAWAAYKRAIGLARATGQARHASAGEAFVAEIEPRLSRLRVEAADAPPGLVVRRGGSALGSAALGVPLAVDPGEHAIEASAPGRKPWSTTVTVAAGAGEVVVEVPPLDVAEASAAPPPPPPPATPPPPSDDRADLRLAGIAVAGGGVLVLGVGVVFGVMTLSDAGAAEDDPSLCPARRCTDAGEAAIDDAETKAWVSNVAIGVGAAAMVAGGVLIGLSLVGDDAAPQPPAATRWSPWASATGGGLIVAGPL